MADADRQLGGRTPNTVNTEFFDSLVRHQTFLMRTSGSIRNEVIALLNATEEDLVAMIRGRLGSSRGLTPNSIDRADRLLKDIRGIRSEAWSEIDNLWTQSFLDIAVGEAKFSQSALDTVLPVRVETKLPAGATLRALVANRPFQGRVLKRWSSAQRAADIQRIDEQVRIGLVQGESSDVIARRVVGTSRAQGTDGITQLSRRSAAALTRTATIAYSNAARQEFFTENNTLFTEELYVATLDSRTTPICRSLDGRRFPVGEGPQPPLHFNCRSLRVAVIGEDVVGNRPFNPTTQRGLLREFTSTEGLGRISSRANLPRGFKGKFDRFARGEARSMIGRVPAKVTYDQFLRRQSTEFQNDTLGVTKARIFRAGATLDRFVDRAGNEIPLRLLSRSDAAAFRAAGLDPAAFK